MIDKNRFFCIVYEMRFFLFLPLILTGCIHSSQKQKKERGPGFYFDRAVYYKEKTNYMKALEQLKELRKQFFYSSYNQKALLLTADIYFAQDKYSQAAQSYEKHLDLYPDTKTDYVLYQIGLSYKNQLPYRSENDLSLAEPALRAFNALLNSNTASSYKEKAKIEKQQILDKKASKELKAALFFKGQGWSEASFNRIQYFIKNYPKSPLMPKALLAGFQLAAALDKSSEEFKKKLINNYPNSPEAQTVHQEKQRSGFLNWKQKLL